MFSFGKCFGTPKSSLLTATVLLVINGVVPLTVGIIVQLSFKGYNDLIPGLIIALPRFCIAIGIFAFLVAATGLYAAVKSNRRFIIGFICATVVVFIFLLSASIASFVIQGNNLELVQPQLTLKLKLYRAKEYEEVTEQWDTIQRNFKCCGVTNAQEWADQLKTVHAVPLSCCNVESGAVDPKHCKIVNAYSTGCTESFGNFVISEVRAIGIVTAILSLVQVLAIGAASWMVKLARII